MELLLPPLWRQISFMQTICCRVRRRERQRGERKSFALLSLCNPQGKGNAKSTPSSSLSLSSHGRRDLSASLSLSLNWHKRRCRRVLNTNFYKGWAAKTSYYSCLPDGEVGPLKTAFPFLFHRKWGRWMIALEIIIYSYLTFSI